MRTYTDEQLVAYADGELEKGLAAEIAAAAASDRALATRIDVFRRSRAALQAAFDLDKLGPVPERLVAPLRHPVPPRATRARLWLPVALAATIAALAISLRIHQTRSPSSSVATFAPDPDAVALALEQNASGVPLTKVHGSSNLEVTPLSTLRLRDGGWCREFDAVTHDRTGLQRINGIACRNAGGRWNVRAYAGPAQGPTAGDSRYELASGPTSDVTATVGPFERLGSTDEEAAIRNHWTAR